MRVKLLLHSFWLHIYSFSTILRVVDIDILYFFTLLEARIIILCCNDSETKMLLYLFGVVIIIQLIQRILYVFFEDMKDIE